MKTITHSSMKLLWRDGCSLIGDVVVFDKLSGHVSGCGPTEAYAREAVRQNAEILLADFYDLNGEAYLVVEG
jgi:hypothetical protein